MVVHTVLDHMYNGRHWMKPGRSDYNDSLLRRLQVFEFADFLDMTDQVLHTDNLLCFRRECSDLVNYNRLAELVSALQRGCDDGKPFSKECLTALCTSIPTWFEKIRDLPHREADSTLAHKLRTNLESILKLQHDFAVQSFFNACDHSLELYDELQSQQELHNKIYSRLTTKMRSEIDDRDSAALLDHQRILSADKCTGEFVCGQCRGYFTSRYRPDRKFYTEPCPYYDKRERRVAVWAPP
jgi:hypothetical protein